MEQRRNALKKLFLSLVGFMGIGLSTEGRKITVTPNKTSTPKDFQKESALVEVIEMPFLMVRAGALTSIASSGLTLIQYKINGGTYATPTYPLAYAANDVVWFTWAYTDLDSLTGNLILIGHDA